MNKGTLKTRFSPDICDHIQNGLSILKDRSFNTYIPDFGWYNMHKDFGASPMYEHLVHYLQETKSGSGVKHDPAALRQTVLRFVDVEEQDFDVSVPLINYGLDSMSASRLSVALKPYITLSQLQLLADMSLLDILARMASTANVGPAKKSDTVHVHDMISKYSRRLSAPHPRAPEIPAVVLITGTARYLGSQLLSCLIKDEDIAAIYALNRATEQSLPDRHRMRFQATGLDVELLKSEKVTFLEGDLTRHGLGLPTALYEKVRSL